MSRYKKPILINDADDLRAAVRDFDGDVPVFIEGPSGLVPIRELDWNDTGIILRPKTYEGG